jgi:hypothetical protein
MTSTFIIIAIALVYGDSTSAGELSSDAVVTGMAAPEGNAGGSIVRIYRGRRVSVVRGQPKGAEGLSNDAVAAGADGPDGNDGRSAVHIYRGRPITGFRFPYFARYRAPRDPSGPAFFPPGYGVPRPDYSAFAVVPMPWVHPAYRQRQYSDLVAPQRIIMGPISDNLSRRHH